jgi:hypothetical protein
MNSGLLAQLAIGARVCADPLARPRNDEHGDMR